MEMRINNGWITARKERYMIDGQNKKKQDKSDEIWKAPVWMLVNNKEIHTYIFFSLSPSHKKLGMSDADN